MINQLSKCVQVFVHTRVLRDRELSSLRQANEEISKRKSRKRKYHKKGTTALDIGEALQLIPKAGGEQEGRESSNKRVHIGGNQRRCGTCRQPGHNTRTCTATKTKSVSSAVSVLIINSARSYKIIL